ncbi:MAG TPA: phosphoribosylaminoimidazolesuccinocarboxamide synthase [Candidatus Binatia bacterium]|jgi:phosphoribosylaminoimidazole-succinocarboxamide synthase|nr:phosphoribosylaminoimidazolesuccinocarboxamide synthase [Candidatus Binatia bacterium]
MNEAVVLSTTIEGLPPPRRGKVRDIYETTDQLLIVATDRVSAFDVVLPDGIPGKGRVLTQVSRFWFNYLAHLVPNHLISVAVDDFSPACQPYREMLTGRAMVVKKAQPLPVECVVRGYLAGSGWQEYRATRCVCGIALPPGLRESERLPEPIFTPSTKAPEGTHDENIPFSEVERLVGATLAAQVREVSLALYRAAHAFAQTKGFLLADTKFEFGQRDGQLLLIDEAFTPDSSRFWRADVYQPGAPQESYDKQIIRNYLISLGWDRRPPAPHLPTEIIAQAAARYQEIATRLTGEQV